MKVILVVALLVGMVIAKPHQPRASVCGYESCPKGKPDKLNVHLVPHTHDDVGWLKTIDQYYYGSKNNIQNAGIQYIFDSVVDTLSRDPAKKFIFVEIAYFWKWWVEQTPDVQDQVKTLINNGQLEFTGGAWSMNDEANTHYQSTIDQFTYSFRKLNETFGKCGQPKVGWQIDPFGHSREQASLMAQYGFDGLFFARLDYQDKANRLDKKSMELVWETSPSLGDENDLFTHATDNHYSTPSGFCWDDNCGDEPMIDNPNIPDYNVPDRVNAFIDVVRNKQSKYRANHLMILFGDDFQYKSAHKNYKNIDKLIRYVNERQSEGSDVNVFYSTPSCYLKSVNEANLTWPTKQDDFFPYASDPNAYWTGYFTSRPTLKYFERQGSNILQVGKQLAAVTKVPSENLEEMQAAMGVMQHHDAITGTEKQAVAEDYARILHKATEATEDLISNALKTLIGKGQSPTFEIDSCRLRNISQCALTAEKESFLVTVYNPLSRIVDYYVRLPVPDATYTVISPDGSEVVSQLLPIPEQLNRVPGRDAKTQQELVFNAAQLPPVGYRSYIVTKDAQRKVNKVSRVSKPKQGEEASIGDEDVTITLDAKTNFLKSISTRAETWGVAQSLQYYPGHDGNNNGAQNRASGAYVFRPATQDPLPITDKADTNLIQGDVVHEAHQIFSPWASQIVRHYNNQPVVEFEWLVGPIPIDGDQGKEIINKFTTTIPTKGLFTTDLSGREKLERKLNFRPSWDLQVNEPVSGNYYPVVTHISFANETSGLAIVTDRAQGGSSLSEGSLEVMVHRRLLHDDAFGVGEALNETQYGQGLVARGRHYVLIGFTNSTVSQREIRLLETRKVLDSLVYLSDITGQKPADIQSKYKLEYSALTKPLPDQVQLLTLEPWKGDSLLLRLEHIFTRDEDSTTVSVDLTNLLADYEITAARETNLAANKWIEEVSRLKWQKDSNELPKYSPKVKIPLALNAVELEPKQIRTFIVDVKAK